MSADMSVDWPFFDAPSVRLGQKPFEYSYEWVHHVLELIMTPLLTIDAVVESLSVSRSTVVRLISDQELDVVRIARAVRVPQDAVERYVDAHTDYARSVGGTP